MGKQNKIKLIKSAVIGYFPAVIWAFLMTSIAIEHNAMGEFFKNPLAIDLEYDLPHLGLIWASWFIPVFVGLSILFFLAALIFNNVSENQIFENFWKKIRQEKQQNKCFYSVLISGVFSIFPATFLLCTALDSGNYNGAFCNNRSGLLCEYDVLEMVIFWSFWFIIPLGILFSLIIWLWGSKKI